MNDAQKVFDEIVERTPEQIAFEEAMSTTKKEPDSRKYTSYAEYGGHTINPAKDNERDWYANIDNCPDCGQDVSECVCCLVCGEFVCACAACPDCKRKKCSCELRPIVIDDQNSFSQAAELKKKLEVAIAARETVEEKEEKERQKQALLAAIKQKQEEEARWEREKAEKLSMAINGDTDIDKDKREEAKAKTKPFNFIAGVANKLGELAQKTISGDDNESVEDVIEGEEVVIEGEAQSFWKTVDVDQVYVSRYDDKVDVGIYGPHIDEFPSSTYKLSDDENIVVPCNLVDDGQFMIVHRASVSIDTPDMDAVVSFDGFIILDEMEGNNSVVGAVLVGDGQFELSKFALEKAGFKGDRLIVTQLGDRDDGIRGILLR